MPAPAPIDPALSNHPPRHAERSSRAVMAFLLVLTLTPWLAAGWTVLPGGLGVALERVVPFGELLFALLVVVVLGLLMLAATASACRRWLQNRRAMPGRATIIAMGLSACLGFVMAWYEAGLRLGFAISHGPLERAVTMGSKAPVRAGLYDILDIAHDPRGGVYLKTGETPNWIDTESFGFVKDPNPEGSPFGNADYTLTPLSAGWYAFAANNDY